MLDTRIPRNALRSLAGTSQNIERLIPWRTLTGRQHLYLDHEAYLAFGENLPTFKPRITAEASLNLAGSRAEGKCVMLNCPGMPWNLIADHAVQCGYRIPDYVRPLLKWWRKVKIAVVNPSKL